MGEACTKYQPLYGTTPFTVGRCRCKSVTAEPSASWRTIEFGQARTFRPRRGPRGAAERRERLLERALRAQPHETLPLRVDRIEVTVRSEQRALEGALGRDALRQREAAEIAVQLPARPVVELLYENHGGVL